MRINEYESITRSSQKSEIQNNNNSGDTINKYKSKQGPLTINELHNDSTARFYECYCEFLP